MSNPNPWRFTNQNRPQARYGDVPGYPVGSLFEDRAHLYRTGMHVTLQAGIQGRAEQGACSIVLSGGYEDDVDLGYQFTYTGHGGQLPRQETDRSQKKDQEWTRGNLALKTSSQRRKPVRVIRGYQLPGGPAEGYRYDGLYDVDEYAREPGKSGFLVCLFRLVRREGQPPLPDRRQYRAGEAPLTLERTASSNALQSPRAPQRNKPHYTVPEHIKALFPPGAYPSEQTSNKTPHPRRNSSSEADFKQGSSSSSTVANKRAHRASMPVSMSGESEANSLSTQRRQLPSFTRVSHRSKTNDSPQSISPTQGNAYSSTGMSKGSIPSSQWKGKQKASEPGKTSRTNNYSFATNVDRETAALRIQQWNRYYNEGRASELADDTDTDGGEFSEGEGITYKGDSSDSERSNNSRKTPPFNDRFKEVIEISSDEE